MDFIHPHLVELDWAFKNGRFEDVLGYGSDILSAVHEYTVKMAQIVVNSK